MGDVEIGGRMDGTCPVCVDECDTYGTECICRDLGEYCYTDFGLWYDVWVFSLLLMFSYPLYHGCVFSWEIIQAKWALYGPNRGNNGVTRTSSKQKLFTPMEAIILLTTTGIIGRFVWTLSVVNSRHPSSSLFLNTTLSAIFLKLPQIFWLSSYLYTALVWQRLLSQSVSLGAKKASQGRTAKLAYRINAFNGILLLVLVPLYVTGCVAAPVLTKIVDLVLMLTILGVSGAGIKFGLNLNKELATTSSGKALVPTIKGVVVMGCTGAFSSIFFGFAYIFFLRASRSKIIQLGFSFVIHQFCEFLIVMALLKTKMDSVKRIKHQEAGFELQSMATSVAEGRDTVASAGSRSSRKDLLKSNTSGVSRPMSGKYSGSSAKNVRVQSFRTKAITEKESSENESNSETSKNPLNSSPGASFGGGKSRSSSRVSMSKKESAKDLKMQSMEVAFNANAKKTEGGREIGAEEAQI